jgi:MFS superfamily sulfate permease-like transporter
MWSWQFVKAVVGLGLGVCLGVSLAILVLVLRDAFARDNSIMASPASSRHDQQQQGRIGYLYYLLNNIINNITVNKYSL